MTAAIFSLFLSILIFLRSIQNLINLGRSLNWLSLKPQYPKINKFSRFIVCIPVLDEQKVIQSTLKKFFNQDYPLSKYSLYVVTTNKESHEKNKKSTAEVVEEYRKSLSPEKAVQLSIVNYPKKDGRMSHQINYLAKKLRKDLAQKNTYFVIYNADSNILPNTFSGVNEQIKSSNQRTTRMPKLLQQSAFYQISNKSLYGAEGAGLHQTLWTLMHEIPKLRRQSSGFEKLGDSKNILSMLLHSRITHCVGHGLYIYGSYYLKHPFSDSVLNEDLPYGLQACSIREPILPIQSLELASTPNRLSAVYKQKSVWFNPFFEFLSFGKELEHKRMYKSKFELKYLIMQAYAPLFIWLIHSFVLLGGLITGIIAGWLYTIVWFGTVLLYWFIPALIITIYRKRLDNGGANSLLAIISGVPYVLTHSIGPLWSVIRWTRAHLYNIIPDKPKTESA